jgi:hypothetical protein
VSTGATLNPGENPPGPANADRLAAESSRGPTLEGLLKPDVVAPGHNLSAVDDGLDPTCQTGRAIDLGTSFAAAAVSGASALVRSYFTDGFASPVRAPGGPGGVRTRTAPTAAVVLDPSNALVKAVLINSARPLLGSNAGDDNQIACTPTMAGCAAPTFGQGWGRVTLDDALYFAGDTRKLRLLHDIWNGSNAFENDGRGDDPELKAAIQHRETHNYAIQLGASAEALRCTLAWSDPAPSPAAAAPLVNDLDFEVHAAGLDDQWDTPDDLLYRGNAFFSDRPFTDPSDPSRDATNPVENIWIDAPRAGVYNLRVYGRNVPGNGLTGVLAEPQTQAPGPTRIDSTLQGYALVCSGGDMTVRQPPLVSIGGTPSPPVVCVEDAIQFDFAAVCNAASGCGPCASFTWDFGDGSVPVVTAVPAAAHVYPSAGLFLASVTARDSCGVEGRSTLPVEVIVGDRRMPPGQVGNTVQVVKTALGLKVTWTDLAVPEATKYHAYDFASKADVSAYPVGPPGNRVRPTVTLLHGSVGVLWCDPQGDCASHPDYLQIRAANCIDQAGP